jgi:formylglycine-generating enzyme required for sulfatase activity
MSMRTDFLGELHKDEPLFGAHMPINVPPLRETQLREVIERPAELLSARFESDQLALDLANRTAEDSTKDAGALPLLSYLLDDMWRSMVERGDGVLRLPAQSIDLGRVLVDRADAFLSGHPNSENALRCILTLKLATVREDGEPTKRQAPRSEFTDDDWRLVTELADHPNRLLVTATPEGREPYAEVAHEAIFRRWEKLRDWIADEREFLVWRTGLEADQKRWETAPQELRNEALLRGHDLARAQIWLAKRKNEIPAAGRHFIELSRRWKFGSKSFQVGAYLYLLCASWALWWFFYRDELLTGLYWLYHVHGQVLTEVRERALNPGEAFQECTHCPKMVVVRADTFQMGSPDGEANERPQHAVTIPRSFAVAKGTVTVEQIKKCDEIGPSSSERCHRPVVQPKTPEQRHRSISVTWTQTHEYVDWLTRTTGQYYRLLSEAEWELSALSAPNYFVGQSDVWEWVEDCYHENYVGAPTDGSAWTGGDNNRCAELVARGGPADRDSARRLVARKKIDPSNDDDRFHQVRVARSIVSEPADAEGPGLLVRSMMGLTVWTLWSVALLSMFTFIANMGSRIVNSLTKWITNMR